MNKLIFYMVWLILLVGMLVGFAYMGHKKGAEEGYARGYSQGVKDGLQKYANHMSDILSGDYKFCQQNGDPLVVATESGQLTFLCQRGNIRYGINQPE